jgi:hypothetical protein
LRVETSWPGRRDAGSGVGSSGRFVGIPSKCALQDSAAACWRGYRGCPVALLDQ